MDSKVSEQKNWTAKHTLTKQDFRQLILEKIERARLLQLAERNRKRTDKELA
jgi:hypothetical protein